MEKECVVYDDLEDALKDAVRHLGGPKPVGARLWADKSPEAAARLLSDCLNPNRQERLSPSQVVFVLRLAREAGYHAPMHYFCAEAGYEPAKPREPEDERAELQRRFIEAAELQAQVLDRLERLNASVAGKPRLVGGAS